MVVQSEKASLDPEDYPKQEVSPEDLKAILKKAKLNLETKEKDSPEAYSLEKQLEKVAGLLVQVVDVEEGEVELGAEELEATLEEYLEYREENEVLSES